MKHGKTAPSDLSPPPRYTETDQVNDTGDDVDYGKPYVFEPDFSGPINKRSCTDVICLLLFLAFLGGWAFIAAFGILNGDISKVICNYFLSLSIKNDNFDQFSGFVPD